jgi:P-type E1-E2 ATPase
MEREGIDPRGLESQVQVLASDGKTAMYVAVDKKLAGVVAVADTIRDSAREAVRALHGLGIQTVMLTGDNRRTAEAVARQLGMDQVIAEVLPEDKSRKVAELQGVGRNIAMVGDGVNDAPALARADVGMAIGAGADVAIEASDVTLLGRDLTAVPDAIALSRATLSTIRENLAFAFVYNALGIPIAAGALYPLTGWMLSPTIASAAMAASSVSVVGNSLRLAKKKLA